MRGAIFDLRLSAEDKALPVVLEELVAMHGECRGVEMELQMRQGTPTDSLGINGIGVAGIAVWAGISDNGRWIAPASVTPGVRHGITGMHERTDLCVGRLGIRSQSGGGTAIPFEADFTNGEYGSI